MSPRVAHLLVMALLGFPMVFTGCGERLPDDRPDLAPVTGKVLRNDQPLADARVKFSPQDQGAPSTGTTGADGTFTLTYRDGQPGAAIGTHRVTVTIGGPTPEQQAQLDAAAEGKPGATPPTDIAPLQTHTEVVNISEGENNVTITFSGM